MTRVFRTSLGSWLVWLGVLVLLAVVGGWNLPEASERARQALRTPVTMFATAAAFCIAWLAAFRLEISEDHVTYRSLLRGSHTVRKADIIAAQFTGRPRRTESPATFVIRTSAGDEVRINAKPFPIEATRALLELTAA